MADAHDEDEFFNDGDEKSVENFLNNRCPSDVPEDDGAECDDDSECSSNTCTAGTCTGGGKLPDATHPTSPWRTAQHGTGRGGVAARAVTVGGISVAVCLTSGTCDI